MLSFIYGAHWTTYKFRDIYFLLQLPVAIFIALTGERGVKRVKNV